MRKTRPSIRLVLGLAVVATVLWATPAAAQEDTDACNGADEATVTNTTFLAGGAAFTTLAEAVASGDNVTAAFDVEGCGEVDLALVGVAGTDVVDAQAGAFAEGSHQISIEIDCLAHVLFLEAEAEAAAEAALEAAESLEAGAEAQGVLDAALSTGVCADVDVNVDLEVCPVQLRARAMGDGSIVLDLAGNLSAAGLLLFRSTGDGAPELLAILEGATYVDTDTEVGVTYTYYVDTLLGLGGSCPEVEVTSVPFFPGAVGAALAATLPALAYVVLRRRK